MTAPEQHPAVRNEQGLARQLSATQQTTMALGTAIGTGLFLATGLSVNVAGPATILSYVIVAGISLLLGQALKEMAVAHPTAGAFGVYAAMYISPFAGYAVRVSYWLMQVIATGGQLVASSIYMAYWFPQVPGAVWVLAFAVMLLYVNSRAVGRLGAIEYWLVMIKVAAVGLFVVLALLVLAGATGAPAIGLTNLTAHGGFMPFGPSGVWLACCFVIYSFIGVEVLGVTSGEAADPARTIPAAMRRMVFGLSAIYIVTVTLLMALTPWNQLGVGESPFVRVLAGLGIPGAAGLMNFVVLSAALVELERQPLPDCQDAVLAGPGRLRAGAAGRGHRPRRPGERAAHLGHRARRGGAGAGPLARLRVCLVLRRRALRRVVRLADDLRDPHRVSRRRQQRRPRRPAGHLVPRRAAHRRHPGRDVVGARPRIDAGRRRAVAAAAGDRLPVVAGERPRLMNVRRAEL